MKIHSVTPLIIGLLTLSLTSCAALEASIGHRKLDVESRMSDSIFLDPTSPRDHIVFISIRNTTDKDLNGLGTEIKNIFQANHWRITDDPEKAHYMLQVNVLQAGQAKDAVSVWNSLGTGYGSVLAGGLAGIATGYATGSMAAGIGTGLGVGVVAGIGGWIADELVKDVTFSIITDVQVSEKAHGKVIDERRSNLNQGNSTNEYQDSVENSNWQKYRTRIASVADKVNLKFPDAEPMLVAQLAKETTGIYIEQN